MRRSLSALLCLVVLISLFFCATASAQLPAEEVGTAELPPPRDSWLMVRAFTDGNYIFDAEDGQMQGLVPHHLYTPALVTVPERGEIYHVDSFLTRRERGERNDVLTVVDLKTLTTKAEIDIPDKAAALPHRGHIALLGDDRHLVVYNLTPAQSVSVVDVIDREFDGEIATPGCAVSLPVEHRAFLMICADGALQLIEEQIEQIERPGWEERQCYAEILRIKGWMLTLKDDPEGAEQNYLSSLDCAREQQAKSWELRTSTSLARLWQQQGKVKEARDLLAPVYDWFTEGFDTKDLKQAKALLTELR